MVGWQRWSRPGFLVKGLAAAAVLLIVVHFGASPKAPEPRPVPEAPATSGAAFRRDALETADADKKFLENKQEKLVAESPRPAAGLYALGGKETENQGKLSAPATPPVEAAALPDGTALAWILPARHAEDALALAVLGEERYRRFEQLDKSKAPGDDANRTKDSEASRARGWSGQPNQEEKKPKAEEDAKSKENEDKEDKDKLDDSPAPRTLTLRIPASRLPEVTRRLAALGARPSPRNMPRNAVHDALKEGRAQQAVQMSAKSLSLSQAERETLKARNDEPKDAPAKNGDGIEVRELHKMQAETMDSATATSEAERPEDPWITLTLTLEDDEAPPAATSDSGNGEKP